MIVHPALSLSIVPFFPRSPRLLDDFAGSSRADHTARHFESVLQYPVHGLAFLFGLVNAGVLLRGVPLALGAASLLRVGQFIDRGRAVGRAQSQLTNGRA